MDNTALDFLLTPQGQHHLAQLAQSNLNQHNHLQTAVRLRRDGLLPAQANALIELTLLRQKATAKFSKAEQMYFDRAGLEMSSAESLSHHRAKRYSSFSHITDLGCGIGGDALGLAQNAHGNRRVIAIDKNPTRLKMATANLAAYNLAQNFTPLEANIQTHAPHPTDAIFFDPARRDAQGKRIHSLKNYLPPISVLNNWQPITQNWGIKISPGVDYAEIPPQAETEFISYKGELREAVLWYGDLRNGTERTATLLPSGHQLTTNHPTNQQPIQPPANYIYEPDPAIIRAHLVQHLATQLNAHQIDPTIAYLTADTKIDTPFATRFTVENWFPFQLKRLRIYLRERQVGTITIKKRGSPLDIEVLRKQLKLKGSAERTLMLTKIQSTPAVIICT